MANQDEDMFDARLHICSGYVEILKCLRNAMRHLIYNGEPVHSEATFILQTCFETCSGLTLEDRHENN